MKEYTAKQPVHGDVCLHCAHMFENPKKTHHWWKFQGESYFRRPDGTVGTASWVVACSDCYNNCDGDVSKIELTGDSVWQGNDPVIKRKN